MLYSAKNRRIYPHIKGGRFYNFNGEKRPFTLLPISSMLVEWYLCKSYQSNIDLGHWFEQTPPINTSQDFAITWIGHSTFLIQISGINILTDPIFGNLSPLFPRFLSPGLFLNQLPPIDFVLLSHNHRDHMDTKSLYFLKNYHSNTSFLVPVGDGYWFSKRGFSNVSEYMWWDFNEISFSKNSKKNVVIRFTFLPAFHWSQRGLFDYNRSLWGSWMIEIENVRIYFAGDSAYAEHFKLISQEFGKIDFAFMPIGPCEPRLWMQKAHMNAEEAGQAFLDLKARHFIPMHWGTFHFGIDGFFIPIERIIKWFNQKQKSVKNIFLHTLKIGKRKTITDLISKQPLKEIYLDNIQKRELELV